MSPLLFVSGCTLPARWPSRTSPSAPLYAVAPGGTVVAPGAPGDAAAGQRADAAGTAGVRLPGP